MERLSVALVVLAIFVFAWSSWNSMDKTCVGSRVAYLERGTWGITHTNQPSLNISSQYSYSIIKKALNADVIADTSRINEYGQLWIVTPTQPFTHAEKVAIIDWVYKGGVLVLITDHTDLFGHATVLNDLVSTFGLHIGKDCVILDAFKQVKYVSPIGWFYGLTANTISGYCLPILFQVGYKERVDYGGKSFFSDNAVTDEDQFGIYCAGAIKRVGNGCVKVFGDSTMFADFALARPSSQLVLRMLRDGVGVLNVPFLALCACFSLLGLLIRGVYGRSIKILSVIVVLVYLVRWGVRTVELSRNRLFPSQCGRSMCVRGNWDLVDLDKGKYGVLFATAYACSREFPTWNCLPCHNGDVHSSVCHDFDEVRPKRKLDCRKDILDVLTSQPVVNDDDMLNSLIKDSMRDGFWFESGVGYLKEKAYGKFWASDRDRIQLHRENKRVLNLDWCRDGVMGKAGEVVVSDIQGAPGWVVVGDWLLGKWVLGDILIRERWQHPDRKFGNIVLVPRGDM